jgi:hypothetical protein
MCLPNGIIEKEEERGRKIMNMNGTSLPLRRGKFCVSRPPAFNIKIAGNSNQIGIFAYDVSSQGKVSRVS